MAIKISTGKGKVPRISPLNKPGGVKSTGIGKSGPVRSGNTSGAGGPHFDHLPAANSYPNAGVKGSNHSPKPCEYTKPGPHWNHMPDTPAVTKP